jgi:1-deoxy-D-xylulose-5-phosphate reductoisomerase
MVDYMDGSVLAQMGIADMRVPISFALNYPDRQDLALDPLDLAAVGTLDFYAPDLDMFPCLGLAYKALEKGDGSPTVMNAANEIAVESFLAGGLSFTSIPEVVKTVMDDPPEFDDQTLSGVLRGDKLARTAARSVVESLGENK